MCNLPYGHSPVKIIKGYGSEEPEKYEPRDISVRAALVVILAYLLIIIILALLAKFVWGLGF